MTLNGFYARYGTHYASFGAHRKNLKEDRSLLLMTEMLPGNSFFQQYKVHANFHEGSLDGALKESGVVEKRRFFCTFARQIFRTFGDKANVIMQHHKVLVPDPKKFDLE